MATFDLPNDGELFTQQILDRCDDLIASGVWEGIGHDRLGIWMNNFSTPTERYFAATILDALIYRSEKQTIALMESLFQRTLPDLLRKHPPATPAAMPWIDCLRTTNIFAPPPVRLVPVIRSDDSPAKSGPALCRLYRRHLGLNQAWMIWPWQIGICRAKGIMQFLFIDDFLGTGEQFCEFADYFKLSSNLKDCYAVYGPLVAHGDGIAAIAKHVPEIHVAAVETIDQSYSLFSDKSHWFQDSTNSPTLARVFYDDLVKKAAFQLKPETLRGFGNLSLTYAFSHATPDNCVPLLWCESANWKPLLDR